jgi:hypothetical protein
MGNEHLHQQAKKRALAKLGFYTHLTVYVVVNLLLISINLISSAKHYWFIWPMLGWGIGICFHGLGTFLFFGGSGLKERMIQREMEKIVASQSEKNL